MQKSSPHDISQDTFSWLTWARLIFAGGIVIIAGMIEPVWAAASDGIADNEVMSTPDEIPNLFLIDTDRTQQHERGRSTLGALPGRYAVRLNPQINAFSPSRAARFLLPQGIIYDVVHDNQMIHPSGSVTWVGYLKDYGDDYRVLITTREGRSFGRILTPDGEFLVESDESGAWLVDVQMAGLVPAGFGDDIALPPQVGKTPIPSQQPHKQLARLGFEYSNTEPEIMAQPQAAGNTTIDVMLLYTSGMASRYGAGLQARLDSLIAVANQAYIDSQVNITLRLVYSTQVNYSDAAANKPALDDLTNNSVPTLTQVNSWRDQYGADLVALLRPYDIVNHRDCGRGWLNGFNGTPISGDQAYGYAVISDGSDVNGSNFYCDDLTLTHELGHTMGSSHERANAGGDQGAFPYSYGYGFEGIFGTIMSYIHPSVAKFSNPNILCAGSSPCGVADYADNARSLNNTRGDVANFKPSQTSSISEGVVLLRNVGSNKCVEVGGFDNANGGNVQQWDCLSHNHQLFQLMDRGNGRYALANRGSNKCMEVGGFSNANGGNVQQWDCFYHPHQLFDLQDRGNGSYALLNAGSGKCMEVGGFNNANGGNVQQWDCFYHPHQLFKIEKIRTVALRNEGSNKCVEVGGFDNANGGNVQQWDCLSHNHQLFQLMDRGNGRYALANRGSNKCMEVGGFSNANGGNVQQWDCFYHPHQLFDLQDRGNGSYALLNAGSGKCMEVGGFNNANGGNVQQWDCLYHPHQLFKIEDH